MTGGRLAMAILAGIDEAGLGPRLGPLVVGLAVFRGPRGVLDGLAGALAPEVRADGRAPVPVGDSKRLYAAARGLHVLERGIYPFVRLATGVLPRSLAEWLGRLELARPDTPRSPPRSPGTRRRSSCRARSPRIASRRVRIASARP